MAYSTLVATELSPQLIEAGAKLLERIDKAQIDISAAFWLLQDEERGWRLRLAAPDVQRFGALSFYGKISPFVETVSPLSLTHISAVKPNDQIVVLLKSAIRTGPGVSGIRFTQNVVQGVLIRDAYIYRLG